MTTQEYFRLTAILFVGVVACASGRAHAAASSSYAWGRIEPFKSSGLYYTTDGSSANYFARGPAGFTEVKPGALSDFASGSRTVSSAGVDYSKARVLKLGTEQGLKAAATVAVTDKIRLPLPAIATAGRVLARAYPLALVGMAIYSTLSDNVTPKLRYAGNAWEKSDRVPTDMVVSDNYCAATYNGQPIQTNVTRLPALPTTNICNPAYYITNWSCIDNGNGTYRCGGTYAGSRWNPLTISPIAYQDQWRAATDAELESGFSKATPTQLADFVPALASNNQSVNVPDATPASYVIGSPTTTVAGDVSTTQKFNSDGTSTTTTKTESQTISSINEGTTIADNRITTNITNNYTTTVRNDQTGATTTTESGSAPTPAGSAGVTKTQLVDANGNPVTLPKEPDYTFTDAAMPAQPNLYTQKYPNGIAGVWAQKKSAFAATPFVSGIQSMFNIGNPSGTCPAWSMNFNIMPGANYGDMSVPVSCTVLQICGLILLTTACFTAWRIIF